LTPGQTDQALNLGKAGARCLQVALERPIGLREADDLAPSDGVDAAAEVATSASDLERLPQIGALIGSGHHGQRLLGGPTAVVRAFRVSRPAGGQIRQLAPVRIGAPVSPRAEMSRPGGQVSRSIGVPSPCWTADRYACQAMTQSCRGSPTGL
jgi:hypothetical protein